MDVDVNAASIEITALTTEEHKCLSNEGRCFNCKRQGHISRGCLQKDKSSKRNAPLANKNHDSCSHQGMNMWVTEVEGGTKEGKVKDRKENCINMVKTKILEMTMEEKDTLLDLLFMQGF